MKEHYGRKPRKDNSKENLGETFYRAHPAAMYQPVEYEAVSLRGLIVEKVLWRMLAIVEVILVVRLILAGFGANGGNLLTSFLYTISYPFVIFFFYLFNTTDKINVTAPHFEIETLAAMSFCYLIIYIVAQIIRGFSLPEE